jgi:RNA polymerase sigma-70 factor, ECF subfamily
MLHRAKSPWLTLAVTPNVPLAMQLPTEQGIQVRAIGLNAPACFALDPAGTLQRATRMLPAMDWVDDDARLMLRYCAGEVRAFEHLYSKHKANLYRYLLRQVRSANTAADLYQEVWARVIASRERYQPRAKFSTFLFQIAHNCAIDFHRRNRHSPIAASLDEARAEWSEPRDPEENRPDAIVEMRERDAEFRQCLERLPAEQREAFLLYEEAGLNVDEIATATGVGAETAKSRLRYAVAKLKKSLSAMHGPQARAV